MADKDTDLSALSSLDPGASAAYASPAVHSVFDLDFGTGATASSVSPQDLLLHDPMMSAPNSTALTTLTSPSIGGESPQFSDCFVSPEFGTADFEHTAEWFSLFPDEIESATANKTSDLTLSPAQDSPTSETLQFTAANGRKKSDSRPAQEARHSSVSGVGSRRRDRPLPPIIVADPSDVVAMKRARNTLAARKSRERRAQRMDELEDLLTKITTERDFWKARAESLSSQMQG